MFTGQNVFSGRVSNCIAKEDCTEQQTVARGIKVVAR